MEKLVFDFFSMLSMFDLEVQRMDCQDYDLDEILSNWILDLEEDEVHRMYGEMFQSNPDGSGVDDGNILSGAVNRLYRKMNRLLTDIDRRRVNRVYINLKEETLIVEVRK